MAKLSSINNNLKRDAMIKSYSGKRRALKEVIRDKNADLDTRMKATFKLAQMPRNGSATRFRNRCEITGRPRGFYRKFKMSRIALRELGNMGFIPGVIKASW